MYARNGHFTRGSCVGQDVSSFCSARTVVQDSTLKDVPSSPVPRLYEHKPTPLRRFESRRYRSQVHKVLDNGLKPILCIGESKEEYEAGLNKEVHSLECVRPLLCLVLFAYPSACFGGAFVSPQLGGQIRRQKRRLFRHTSFLYSFNLAFFFTTLSWHCVCVRFCFCVGPALIKPTSRAPNLASRCPVPLSPPFRSVPCRWGRVCRACPPSRWRTWSSRTSRWVNFSRPCVRLNGRDSASVGKVCGDFVTQHHCYFTSIRSHFGLSCDLTLSGQIRARLLLYIAPVSALLCDNCVVSDELLETK